MLPWYVSADKVAAALDSKETARNRDQVERAVSAASRSVEGDLLRRFYPEVATYTFARPVGCGRVLFLDNEIDVDLVSLGTLTVDGAAVATTDRDLLPVDGPPFSRIEFGTSISFGSTRRPIQAADTTWGYDEQIAPAGELAAAISDTTGTTVDVSDGSLLGVGDLLNIETERVIVAARAMLATGQTLQGGMGEQVNDRTLTVADGTQIHAGEVLLVDAERMLAIEVSGNDVLVRRNWDGSVLASHISGASVLGLRRLTVERGVLGTTAATHTLGTAATRQVYPGPVVAYTAALALQELLGESSGYGREIAVSGGETQIGGRGLDLIRDDARRGYRRILLG